MARYNFKGTTEQDLPFNKGDVLTIIVVTKVTFLFCCLRFYEDSSVFDAMRRRSVNFLHFRIQTGTRLKILQAARERSQPTMSRKGKV